MVRRLILVASLPLFLSMCTPGSIPTPTTTPTAMNTPIPTPTLVQRSDVSTLRILFTGNSHILFNVPQYHHCAFNGCPMFDQS